MPVKKQGKFSSIWREKSINFRFSCSVKIRTHEKRKMENQSQEMGKFPPQNAINVVVYEVNYRARACDKGFPSSYLRPLSLYFSIDIPRD